MWIYSFSDCSDVSKHPHKAAHTNTQARADRSTAVPQRCLASADVSRPLVTPTPGPPTPCLIPPLLLSLFILRSPLIFCTSPPLVTFYPYLSLPSVMNSLCPALPTTLKFSLPFLFASGFLLIPTSVTAFSLRLCAGKKGGGLCRAILNSYVPQRKLNTCTNFQLLSILARAQNQAHDSGSPTQAEAAYSSTVSQVKCVFLLILTFDSRQKKEKI